MKNSNRWKLIFPQQLKDVKFLIKKMIYSVDTECRASGSAFQGRPIESFFKRNELAISFSTLFLQQGQKRAGRCLNEEISSAWMWMGRWENRWNQSGPLARWKCGAFNYYPIRRDLHFSDNWPKPNLFKTFFFRQIKREKFIVKFNFWEKMLHLNK